MNRLTDANVKKATLRRANGKSQRKLKRYSAHRPAGRSSLSRPGDVLAALLVGAAESLLFVWLFWGSPFRDY